MSFNVKENKEINEKYYYKVHKTGLPIYVFPKKHSTAFAVIGTRYGSVDTTFKTGDDKEFFTVPDGVAHFLEHKLFEDENGNDAFVLYAQYGGNANAFTSFVRTAYLFSCTNNFNENLEVLLDFVTHPYFSEQTVKKEQGIIGEEIKMYEDNPGWRVFFNMLGAMYVNNPVRRDIAGTIESISQITPKILYKCYNSFYNLHNMALCVCGDVTPEQVEAVCDKVLVPAADISISRMVVEEPEHINKERVTLELEVAQPLFNIGIKDVPAETPEKAMRKSAVNEILLQLLFGKSSDFYNRHNESGLINSKFSASFEQERQFAFVEISGSCENPDGVKQAVCEEITLRKEEFFTREEFERTKKAVYANFLFNFDSTEEIATDFLSFIFADNDMLDYPAAISSVTYEEAKETLISSYDISKCVLSIIFPKK
jgi:predicted Zn-dependent peptidase